MVHFASLETPPMLVREQLALVDSYRMGQQSLGRPSANEDGEKTSETERGRRGGLIKSANQASTERPPDGSTPNPGSEADSVFSDRFSVKPLEEGLPVNPLDDVEALEALEQKITTLAARIHAATHRLLMLIADFDRRQGWQLGGHRSCAHWLSFQTGIDLGTAREKVRTARALVGLPETSASMSRGELSFSKVRAVTRVATPANEKRLLAVARGSTTAQLEQRVRSFKRGSREDEAALERRRFESRTLSVFSDNEGMYVVRGRLPAEVGALLMRAVEAASDALYLEEQELGKGKEHEAGIDSHRVSAQRRADALGLLAERALAAGFGGEREGAGARADAEASADSETGGDSGAKARTPVPIKGTRAERYQVMLHVEAETLNAEGEGGRSELEDGTRVSAETSQRLSCDAGLVRVRHDRNGGILDVGRRTRTIPPALRRALEVRDKGCRFPGCGSRFTEGHHVTHWAEGGETSLRNCLLLCRHHHRLVHEGGWRVEWRGEEDRGEDPRWNGEGRGARRHPAFLDPRGGVHTDAGGLSPGA